MSGRLSDTIEKAAALIHSADALFITAGAGMGVDSGLPDFRGREGFWNAYPPIAKLGLSFEAMANPRWFGTNPRLAWAFYGHRLNLYRRTVPHEGFTVLHKLARAKPGGYFVFTSNVDGQFQKAGFPEEYIEECHGAIHHLQCADVCSESIWEAGGMQIEIDELAFEAIGQLPACATCGGMARPNILMFSDWNWIPDRTLHQERKKSGWMETLKGKGMSLAIMEIGAGLAVPTVRMASESAARESGGALIRINPRDCSVPAGGISLPMGAQEGLTAIGELLKDS